MKTIAEVMNMVRSTTNLAYLFSRDADARPHALKADRKVTTFGCTLRGQFIRCLQGSLNLRAGTPGWVISSPKLSYSEYVWIGDEQYPAKNAITYIHGWYHTWLSIVEIDGNEVVAESFESVEYPEKRVFQAN